MTSRVTRFFRALFSPRLGHDGSAASSAPPPHHTAIGIETNAAWADAPPPTGSPRVDDQRHRPADD